MAQHRGSRPVAALAALAALLVGATAAAGEPHPARIGARAADRAVSEVPPGACKDQVREELLDGRRADRGCQTARVAATTAVRKRNPRWRIGVVESRRVELARVRLVVSTARRCRRWALGAPGSTVLEPTEARRAGCRVRRYEGRLSVSVIDGAGKRHADVHTLHSNVDGRVTLEFSALDVALRSRELPAIDELARVELGRGGWAGSLDLARMRDFIANWHFEWIRRGRGAPGLFVVRHPDHEHSGAARALAVEASLARQERDYLAVGRGELHPRSFLDRYVWSPYRRSVRSMARPGTAATPRPAPGEAISP